MAGHRHARSAPRRDETRTQRMRQRYESEADPAARLAWAYDWLRFELGHLARSRVPAGRELAAALTRDIAAELAGRAQEVNARSDGQ